MTDADIVREALGVREWGASITPSAYGERVEREMPEAFAALDRLLARVEQAERERDEAREDAADARGYLEAVRVMRDRYEARYGKHRQRAEAAERERDTLREALEGLLNAHGCRNKWGDIQPVGDEMTCGECADAVAVLDLGRSGMAAQAGKETGLSPNPPLVLTDPDQSALAAVSPPQEEGFAGLPHEHQGFAGRPVIWSPGDGNHTPPQEGEA